MSSALGVSWERVEEATDVYKEYYCKWRPKVEKGQEVGTMDGVYRRMVVEVAEEAKERAAFNWTEFPYDAPSRGELPGFFAMQETVEREKLRQSHHAIHREAGFLEAYGYWEELGAVAHDLAVKMGRKGTRDVAAGATQAEVDAAREKREEKEDRLAVLFALGRVLNQVSMDCMRQRKRFVRMCGNEGLAAASWMMDHVVAAGEVGESDAFGVVERKMRDKTLEERLKVRAKMEAHRMEGAKFVPEVDVAASGAAPDGGPSARRN